MHRYCDTCQEVKNQYEVNDNRCIACGNKIAGMTLEQYRNIEEKRIVEEYADEMRTASYRDLPREPSARLQANAAVNLLIERGWKFVTESYKGSVAGWWYHPEGAGDDQRPRLTPARPAGNATPFFRGAYDAFRLYEAK